MNDGRLSQMQKFAGFKATPGFKKLFPMAVIPLPPFAMLWKSPVDFLSGFFLLCLSLIMSLLPHNIKRGRQQQGCVIQFSNEL